MNLTRVCKGCAVEKPITEYYGRSGSMRRQWKCKPCYNKSNKEPVKRGFQALPEDTQANITQLMALGVSIRKIATKHNIKYSTLLSWHLI